MEQYDTPEGFGKGPEGEARRWLMELSLSSKTEKEFRETGKKVIDLYRGKNRRKNSFNILWSNTETLAPAVFNSPPQPNVRRRFKDEDPVGKAVSQLMERALEFQTDTEQFITAIKMDVLDLLLPGRGVSRIRYVPSLSQVGAPDGADESSENERQETQEGPTEELAWEQCVAEHVQWDDFRRGPGRSWEEVQWVAFRHRMTRDELIKKFGEEIGNSVTLDEPEDEDLKQKDIDSDPFKTAEVWEMWCMCDRKVRFLSNSYKSAPLMVIDDPLKLNGFWPIPRPMYAVQDPSCLEPIALFEQYREQSDELNKISSRINKIIDACKIRGIYDATLTSDIDRLMKAGDNELIPMQNAAAWMEKGGIEKAIYMMPIEDVARTLALLYQQREQAKQVIYEVTGIADVMRGSTDPNETLGAQQLKAQWGGQRVQALQREVQRYVRDLIRIMAEVCAERFQPETLMRMTGLKFPSKMELQMAQQAGQQQIPPDTVTIEQVMEVLRDDATRMFRVDVETDSMIAATQEQDMAAMNQLLSGISGLVNGLGPAVQQGAIPVEAVKEMILAVTRRARLGSVVEDAFDKMQPPKPQSDPAAAQKEAEQAKLQAKMQMDQQALAHKQQLDQASLQHNLQLEQQRAMADAQIERERMQAELAKAQQEAVFTRQLEVFKAQQDERLQVILAHIKKDTAIEVAHINNEGKLIGAEISAKNKSEFPNVE